ncbi:glycoside hydrolase family 10 [Gemmatirosa kalamazoonensis]|uniref:Beta-xylanase n=1 Tax=Gemmatirosa kalamazoonensis TaxID=861299 RepID=W0RR43_9BACT|nr:endo-1,4-beta-xylanase [Gemmatirosa kalamazoonensis]AHG92048.1 glycoside hydrolase family 10 [Gemmatirosa kalamazoonensis]
MKTTSSLVRAAWCGALMAAACGHPSASPSPAAASLKNAFRNDFRIGTAIAPRVFDETDSVDVRLVKTHFNAITPENVLKWEVVHPRPNEYDFSQSDRYVAFGERNGMFIVGHTLVWHSQTPRWVFQDSAGQPLTRDALLARMKDHIEHVMGRYKGRIKGWDVVNEALNEDGTMRQSPWYRIIGDDFVVKAFEYAHAVDPAAELYYNDYNLATPAKRDGAIALAKRIRAAGIPVAAINSQDHHKLDPNVPSVALVDSMFQAIGAAGFHANVTELDVDVLPRPMGGNTADVSARAQMAAASNPYTASLPDSVQQQLARRYAALFAVYEKHRDIIDRVTFWGVTDATSWLNGFPVRGRTNWPLLFDRQGRPKPAFDAVLAAARRQAM